jgi:hypothetical protein
MRTLKGILLGSAIYVVVFVFFVIVTAWRLQSHFNSISSPMQGEMGMDLVTMYHNMGFPLWLLLCYPACLIIGYTIVARWPYRGVPVP